MSVCRCLGLGLITAVISILVGVYCIVRVKVCVYIWYSKLVIHVEL